MFCHKSKMLEGLFLSPASVCGKEKWHNKAMKVNGPIVIHRPIGCELHVLYRAPDIGQQVALRKNDFNNMACEPSSSATHQVDATVQQPRTKKTKGKMAHKMGSEGNYHSMIQRMLI
ncbi:hypothetical protein Drorol1_Dr00003442 [Drosera rotundifolia]